MTQKCQNLGKVVKKISLKVSTNYFSQVYVHKFCKNVINAVNLVKIGHFWGKWSKLGHFGGKNDVISQNFGQAVKKFSLKVSKNYFSQVYGNIFGLKCH